jgi:hypothetical protein
MLHDGYGNNYSFLKTGKRRTGGTPEEGNEDD